METGWQFAGSYLGVVILCGRTCTLRRTDDWGSVQEHLCHMWITSPQLQLCFTVGGGREQLDLDPVGHTSASQGCEGTINVTSSLLFLISLLKPGEN